MFAVNDNYGRLQGSYLFSEIGRRVSAFQEAHPDKEIIRLGIGDVTRPLVPAVVDAIKRATDEMANAETFHGYSPDQGYDFLIDAICTHEYRDRGLCVDPEEIFISDGAKCDTGNFQELFSPDARIAVTDPVYPVYVDTNVMAGRSGQWNAETGAYDRIVYLPCTAENDFTPPLPETDVDVVYLCSPNNPTGTAMSRPALQKWVDWANDHGSLIAYDGAYERFITEDGIPHSIYECDGARTCAVEFRSFSKTAGFTGTRCAYTVVPKDLMGRNSAGEKISLHDMWLRRHATKFNGVSYIVQRGAQAVYTPEGSAQVEEVIKDYLKNAAIILAGLKKIGVVAYGGINAPYVWLKTPDGMKSWDFFDRLLQEAAVVGTPGAGFGRCGEGYFRLTAFNTKENTERAIDRIERLAF